MSPPRRILLVRLSHLGDVVHALPIFHALRASHPEARIAWVVQREFAGLLEGMPGLDRVIAFDRRGGAAAWPALRAELSELAPDWAIDAQGNTKSAMATLCSGAPRRTGLAASDWTEPFGAHVLTDQASEAVPPPGLRVAHAMDRMAALARHVSAGSGLRTDPALASAERDYGRFLCQRWLGRAKGGAILHLAAPEDVRSWPLEQFAELARALARAGRAVLVLSGPGEEAAGRALASELEDVRGIRHEIGQRGLRDLAAFFTAAAERESRLIACDSGPMHLAAACGLRVVCLSGAQDPRRTGPWPVPHERDGRESHSPHRVVRADPEPECAPCLARTCSHPRGKVCMAELLPERVLAELV